MTSMLLSLVVPVFNEVETLGLLFPALKEVLRESGCSSEPALILQMLELYRSGFEVVSAQRISRASESRFKSWTASARGSTVPSRLRALADQRLESIADSVADRRCGRLIQRAG